MGILVDQAVRLMRESWNSPKELAEELYAMFMSDQPVKIDTPVQIVNNTTNQPAVTIYQGGKLDDAVTINRRAPASQRSNFEPPPEEEIEEGPPFSLTIINSDGTIESTSDPEEDPQPVASGGGAFPGDVVSGPGSTYAVDVYESGLSISPVRKTCTAIGLSSSAEIPTGTRVLCFKIGANYFLDVPRWL